MNAKSSFALTVPFVSAASALPPDVFEGELGRVMKAFSDSHNPRLSAAKYDFATKYFVAKN